MNHALLQEVPFDPAVMRLSDDFGGMLDRILASGTAHEEDYKFLGTYPPAETLIVDVGSNIGNSAVSFNNVLPGVRIAGFEPNRILQSLLERAQAHCPGFTFTQVGLGETATDLRLHVPVVDGVLIAGEASVDPDQFLRAEVATRLRGYSRDRRFAITSLACRIERLDDQAHLFTLAQQYRKRIVKIDVEGTELSVLRGGRTFLATFRPTLIIEEGHRTDITALLAGMGYSRYLYAPQRGGLVEAADKTRLNSVFVWRPLS
ncbi:MAG: FkbM family methyltransferase [Rhodobacteraceae bacterium]|nr:FkbM family methyltransferase [Paracoccaceae bacterium]